MTTTPNLAITELVAGQENSETTVNTSFLVIETLLAGRIEDKDLTAPPGSPADGTVYIVATSPTGGWAGQAGKLAIYNHGWTFVAPVGGMTFYLHDEKERISYSSQESEWFPVQKRHSTTEHWTGRYGESGSKIYAKSFTGLACPNSATTNHAHSITNLDATKRVNFEGSFTDGTTVSEFNFTNGSVAFYMQITATNIVLISTYNASGQTADIRLEYTKTS